jgi:hypothetical protein
MKGQGKARKLRQIAPEALELILKDEDAVKDWTKDQLRHAKKRITDMRGLLYGREAFVMPDPVDPVIGWVGGICCSHAWASDCWSHNTPYPPAANRTPMAHCPLCGADVPFLVMENEGSCCADCRCVSDHQQYGPSVSGVAISAIRERKIRQDPAEEQRGMLPEDTSSLNREIERAETGEFVPV